MGRAFPPHDDCPVPSVSAITGVLVSSCKVDDPADPIYSFPIFSMPIPNPPSYNFGCYRPSAKTTVAFNQVVPYFSADVKFPRSSDTGNCEPKFRFNIGFPASDCPDISASASIHLLPPGHSPSVNLKVHKSSTNCSFDFKLDIGIPGGQCTSVSAGSTDADDPPPLEDGDDFSVLTGVDISEDDSGACTLFKLQFNRVKFTLDILDGAFDVNPNPGANPGCCETFQVVSNITGWAYPPAIGGGPGVSPTLQFSTVNIQMPQVFIEGTGTPTPMTIVCGGSFDAVVGFDSISTEDCPCGLRITPLTNRYTITPPDLSQSHLVGVAPIVLASGPGTVVTAIAIDNTSGPCDPVVDWTTNTISLGGLTCDWSGICGVSCTSTSLIVKHDVLSFTNGLLMGVTGDCGCA